MKSILLSIFVLSMSTQATAMISGYYMSVNEIQAITSSQEVSEKLGSAYRIESIVGKEIPGSWGSSYEVTSTINTGQKCSINVLVEYTTDNSHPENLPILNLKVGTRTCK